MFSVTLDTSSLVGHPAGPFYLEVAFTDGSGIGDANNIVTLNSFDFGGGSALGGALTLGGATGSLETGASVTDSSPLSLFVEPFAPGLQLSFRLGLTSNDDEGGTPDGFTFFLLDSSGAPLPTQAPFGDYFIGADLGSSGALFETYGSDPARPPSVGAPVSILAPAITPVSSIPEPSTLSLLGGALLGMGALRRRLSRKVHS